MQNNDANFSIYATHGLKSCVIKFFFNQIPIILYFLHKYSVSS